MSERSSDGPEKPSENVGRRGFLKAIGVASALPLAASPAVAAMAAPASNQPMKMDMGAANGNQAAAAPTTAPAPAAAAEPAGYQFFNANESEFVEALVDTLIPHDQVGPGALELGVNTYIDRQMAGAYGKGDRLWTGGPYGQGTPQQGWQFPMTPSEFVRAGIADVDAYALATQGNIFSSLSADKRAAVLKEVESGKANLATVPPAAWFGEVLELTIEGYFGDPLYGGNKGKGAWAMIGFPGADAMYVDKIEPFRNKPYAAPAKSIQDLI